MGIFTLSDHKHASNDLRPFAEIKVPKDYSGSLLLSGDSDAAVFKRGYIKARRLSNERLLHRINNMYERSKYEDNTGYIYEAKARNLTDPVVNNFNMDTYYSNLKLTAKKTSNAARNTILGAAGLTGVGLLSGHLTTENSTEVDKGKVLKYQDYMKSKGVVPTLEFDKSKHVDYYFDPEKNFINTGGNLEATAHEFGHAANHKAYVEMLGKKNALRTQTATYATLGHIFPTFRPFMGPLRAVPLAGLVALPLLNDNIALKIRGNDKDSVRYQAGSWAYENPEKIMAAAAAPILIEEGSASARALKHLTHLAPEGQKLQAFTKGIKVLGPAFGTYAAAGSLPILAGYLKKRYRQNKLDENKYVNTEM